MKNKLLFLFIMIIAVFMVSCGGHFFNPRYYYNKSSSSSSGNNTINIPEVEAPPEVSADEDPFKVNSDYNNPNYGGYEASRFDSWLFKASFRDDKLPIYTFFDDNSRSWIGGGMDWNNIPANYYQGKNGENKAQGYDIKNLTVYKYDRDNPLYDDKGYLPGRMDRFRFYSINGESGVGPINAPLKQYLIAVDTYSKFVFAFGKITEVQDFVGQKVPIGFEAIELHGNKIHFYEYDPIGYVDKTGEVVLYQHYIDEFVANPTSYSPKQHDYPNYAEHSKAKPGKSPYVPLNSNTEANNEDQQKYKDEIKKYLGEYKYRDYSGYKPSDTSLMNLEEWRNGGYAGKSLVLYKYQFTKEDQLVIQEEKFGDLISGSSKTYNLKIINTSYKAIYENANDPKDTLSVSIVQNDNGVNTISINGKVLDKNFNDYGAIFTDRVMGAKFVRGSVSYEFNSDGTEFIMKDGSKSWTYTLSRFDNDPNNNNRAAYGVPEGTWGTAGDIRHGWAVFENNNNDIIKLSRSYGTIITPGSGSAYKYDADRVKQ